MQRRLISSFLLLTALAACTVTLPPVLLTGTFRTTELPDGGMAFEAEITSVTPLDAGTATVDAGTAPLDTGVQEDAGSEPFPPPPPPSSQAELTLDEASPRQTIVAWEATSQLGQFDCPDPAKDNEILDAAVHMGIERLRLELRSGLQHGLDYYTMYINDQITRDQYKNKWYDPERGAPYQWAELDDNVEAVVLPFLTKHPQGQVTLTFVDFNKFSGYNHRQFPDEYALFISNAFQHLDATYGFTPDAVEIILEADLAGSTTAEVSECVRATRAALASGGYSADILAPSSTNATHALDTYRAMSNKPDVLTYHRYQGVSAATLQAIGALGVRTAMLEYVKASIDTLWEDLTVANVEAWQQFALSYCGTVDDGSKYFVKDPTVRVGALARFFSQIMREVRPGAVRYPVTKMPANTIRAMGFKNTDGRRVFVLQVSGETAIEMGSGTWAAFFTSDGQTEMQIPMAGGTIVHMPEAGYVTVYEPAP